MKLAIKKPKGVIWKTQLSFEDIQKMLQAGKITEKWLVCPLGKAGEAVSISELLANPSVFKAHSNKKKEASKTKTEKQGLNVLLPCLDLAYFPNFFGRALYFPLSILLVGTTFSYCLEWRCWF